jgi:hypothetical protein
VKFCLAHELCTVGGVLEHLHPAIRRYSVGSKDAVSPTYASGSGWSRLYEAYVTSRTQSVAVQTIEPLCL